MAHSKPLTSFSSITELEDIQFLDTTFGKHTCIKCQRNLLPPVHQSKCGHRFCKRCCDLILTSASAEICPGKEPGCVILTTRTLFPDRATDRDIWSKRVYCKNHPKCQITPTLKLFMKHLEECEFNLVPCSNKKYGCNQMISRRHLDQHLQTECQFRPQACEYCNQHFASLSSHIDGCKEEIVSCDYEAEGCSFRDTRYCLKIHLRDNQAMHLILVKTKVKDIHSMQEKLHVKLNELEMSTQKQENSITDMQSEQTKLAENYENVHTSTVAMISSQDSKLQRVHNDIVLVKKSTTQIAELQDRVLSLEVRQRNHPNRAEANFSATEKAQFRSNDQTLAAHDVRLAEYDIRFRCIETASHDGTLLWKFTNFRSRKAAAIEGKTISYYSQPFYTHRFGYKMCARVYPNGDGMGKNTHVSLYFVVMKGEYDALLKWPFRQRITMALLDQNTGTNHKHDSFNPDHTSSSFQRPINAMNIASGSPLFVEQSVLESSTYLRDDTVFIMFKVDTANIQLPFVGY